mgnify:CR=1 FL=1
MDWCWYSCCAYGDWCHPDSSEFTDSEAIRKNVSETERHILGETSQWAGNTDPAVLPYWLVWKGAEWDIYFVPFYNGKDGNSAFVRGGNLCFIFLSISAHLLVSLGIISYKERRGDIYLILSVLLLFIAGAVIFYYIGWQYL